jgi:serine/threonine-protein kinase
MLDRARKDWILAVARKADPDPTDWRDRARDPPVRINHAALVELIKTAPVADESVPLLLALDRQLYGLSKDRLPFLLRVQQAHPGDFWVNLTLGDVLFQESKAGEAIRYYQAAVGIRPRMAYAYYQLGMALMMSGRLAEAVEHVRQAADIDPTSVLTQQFLALLLSNLGRYDEAIELLQASIRANPKAVGLYPVLGEMLEGKGRHAEALAQYQQAVALDPKCTSAQSRIRVLLVQMGRGDEARAAWSRMLEADPPEYSAWDGYAEFCLFIGQEDEYRRARQALLSRFGETTDPFVATKTARACLLQPTTEDELRQAIALVERALASDRSKHQQVYPFFLFARGLAEYRQGRLDQAISTLRGKAPESYGPARRLVLAMALHRDGQVTEARKTLAAAVLAHDWRANQAREASGWLFHVLRREAERMILPDLPAFLEGKHQPTDNDERLALFGLCQATNRNLAAARLYADALADAPELVKERGRSRYHAAVAAVEAGFGRGDAAALSETERARWRRQALEWLLAELAADVETLDHRPASASGAVWPVTTHWQANPDLNRLRDPAELDRLPVAERKDWLALWAEVDALLVRARR